MKTVILTCRSDEMLGGLGLVLAGMVRDESVNPSQSGDGIAHDLIEHVNSASDIGTINDEFEALGALWYVRGRTGRLRRDYVGSAFTVHQNIAADVERMFRDYIDGDAYVDVSPMHTRPCDADVDLKEILREASERAYDEIQQENQERAREEWPAYRARCLAQMRKGYRKAARKYRNTDANAQFWAIAGAVDACLKTGELVEGVEFVLTYGNGTAYCESRYNEEY